MARFMENPLRDHSMEPAPVDSERRAGPESRTVAFVDIGTNSIRLLVARINPDGSFSIRSRQKEAVRLGEGEFGKKAVILPGPMDRAIAVARRFRDMALGFGAAEVIAVATSATREAGNRSRFLGRLRREALLGVRLLSGREEARLIYLGVAGSLHLSGKKALLIDIGGGSTEISVGDGGEPAFLASLKLGGLRLAGIFPDAAREAPVGKRLLREMRECVHGHVKPVVKSLREAGFDLVVGSSGTIGNLGQIGLRNFPRPGQGSGSSLTTGQLRSAIALLAGMPLGERRRVAGLNPVRADIIVPGAVILEALMEELGIGEIRISRQGLQDGLLVEYLSREPRPGDLQAAGIRERSVLRLARACGVDEGHARSIQALSFQLFDSARQIGLHDLGQEERELLGYSAFLHDAGKFISFPDHHEHSSYIVRHADLPGFDDTQLAVMADAVRTHRKKAAGRGKGKEEGDRDGSDRKSRETGRILGMLLRIAESLDRSHAGLVREAGFTRGKGDAVVLGLRADGECDLEIRAAEKHRIAFASVFGKELVIRPRCGQAERRKRSARD
jgi:exopolyphosphatase / guanosine-5'-triphosphate,3'-diphosphate pyrophosphatase